MKKIKWIIVSTFLALLCLNPLQAQDGTTRNSLGIDMMPVFQGREPGLLFTRNLRTGALRIRGQVDALWNTTVPIRNLGNNSQENYIASFGSQLAIGWQKEKTFKWFGIYAGPEAFAAYQKGKAYNLGQTVESNGDIFTNETISRNSLPIVGAGLVGGVRFRISDKFSITWESSLLVQHTWRNSDYQRTFTSTVGGVTSEEIINDKSRDRYFEFSPFRSFRLYFNLHF